MTPWTAACQASLSWIPWAVFGFEPDQFLFLLVWPWTRNSATMSFSFLIWKTDNISCVIMVLRIKWTQVHIKFLAPWLTRKRGSVNNLSSSLCLYYFNHKHKMECVGKSVKSQYFTNYDLQNNDSWQLKIGRKDGGKREEGREGEREEVVSLVK